MLEVNRNDNIEILSYSEVKNVDGFVGNYEVTVEGRIVELTFKEYELLKLLTSNRGRVYTREALLNRIWGYDYYGGDRTVDVHMRRLRAKIPSPYNNMLKTIRNVGYMFSPQD